MLDTPQRYPANVKRGNWIQTMPGKGYFPMLQIYSPLEPFFAKTWRSSEVEVLKCIPTGASLDDGEEIVRSSVPVQGRLVPNKKGE